MHNRRASRFIKEWVSENVHNVLGLEDQRPEVIRLSAKLRADAAAQGTPRHELDESLGDIEDYLGDAYLNVHDPDAGGFS